MVKERNIALCIILSLVTCGIYAMYWLYCLATDMNTITKDENSTSSGGMVILLSLVTCGIYHIYWMYKTGAAIDSINARKGGSSSNGIIFLLLSLFGFAIVGYALTQDFLNKQSKNGGTTATTAKPVENHGLED